jgi:hypothetical protein
MYPTILQCGKKKKERGEKKNDIKNLKFASLINYSIERCMKNCAINSNKKYR